jgi:hypothetical protein
MATPESAFLSGPRTICLSDSVGKSRRRCAQKMRLKAFLAVAGDWFALVNTFSVPAQKLAFTR